MHTDDPVPKRLSTQVSLQSLPIAVKKRLGVPASVNSPADTFKGRKLFLETSSGSVTDRPGEPRVIIKPPPPRDMINPALPMPKRKEPIVHVQ